MLIMSSLSRRTLAEFVVFLQVDFGVVYVHLVLEFGGVLFMFFQFIDVAALYECWCGL